MADFLFAPVPHDEAVDFIASKPVVSREVFNRLLPELRARAFTITGVDAASAVQAIRDRIADLPSGSTWDAVKKDIARQISPHFIDADADPEERDKQVNASNRRAELLLRTHGFQAYQTASFDRMSEQRDVLPYWQYVSMGDGRVRPSHAALNGVVLPAASPFWNTHFPPWDFGCRCQAVPLSKEDHDDIKVADAGKLPEQQRIIEGPALKELELNNRLFRGPNQIANVSPPSGPNAYHWHPGDRDLSVADLRARYDTDVFDDFEKWARKQELSGGKTLWAWIGGNKPAFVPAATSTWPSAINELTKLRDLGGSTGAQLMLDPHGRQFVLKRGNSAAHIEEEFAADQAYRALGVAVPEARLYQTAAGPAKLAEHIDGEQLGTWLTKASSADRAATLAKLQAGFAADALLGNWDVVGMNLDNVLVDKAGTPWRIDNGGSLRFRAQGAAKTADQWNGFAAELWSLRDQKANPKTAPLYAGLDIFGIARQVEGLDEKALLAALPVDLHPVVSLRLANLRAVAAKALDMEHDAWKAGYTDDLTRHMMGLRKAGIVDRLPKRLDQAPGGVTVKDENGVLWDDLRTHTAAPESAAPAPAAHPLDKFGPDLVAAAKNVNAHNAKGDFAYNAAKIASALAHEASLVKLASSSDPATKAMADHYLDALRHLKASVEAGAKKQNISVPTLVPFVPPAAAKTTPKPAAPAGSIVAQAAAYVAAQGGTQDAPRAWMESQAGDSWKPGALAYKHWLSLARNDDPADLYWHTSSAAKAKAAFTQFAKQHGGEEKLGTALTAWHALVQESLGAVDFRYNDRGRRVVRLIRTEKAAALTINSIQPGDAGVHMKRGLNESCSVFTPYFLHGDKVTVQAVPHSRITGLYLLERSPGLGSGSFAGDHENEFTATLARVPLTYLKTATSLTVDDGQDAAAWKLDLSHLRP